MDKISGMHVYYYMVCKRKLWYFTHSLRMEHEDENVALGKIIDDNYYSRQEKSINIDNVINIDFIRNDLICETKKSRKIEDASIMQLKYYLFYLKSRGVDGYKGEINYPLLKQKVVVELTEGDIKELENICSEVLKIMSSDKIPVMIQKGMCKKCAYYNFCKI